MWLDKKITEEGTWVYDVDVYTLVLGKIDSLTTKKEDVLTHTQYINMVETPFWYLTEPAIYVQNFQRQQKNS